MVVFVGFGEIEDLIDKVCVYFILVRPHKWDFTGYVVVSLLCVHSTIVRLDEWNFLEYEEFGVMGEKGGAVLGGFSIFGGRSEGEEGRIELACFVCVGALSTRMIIHSILRLCFVV
ncbi:hypothetical protein FXO38_06156 [Capsicum annuum]|nr:hypothetical protein FXO38_06156 [Capsicum annuum]